MVHEGPGRTHMDVDTRRWYVDKELGFDLSPRLRSNVALEFTRLATVEAPVELERASTDRLHVLQE